MVNSLKNRLYFFALFGRAEHEAQEADLKLETLATGDPPSRVSRVPCSKGQKMMPILHTIHLLLG